MFAFAFIGSNLFFISIVLSHFLKLDLRFKKDALSKYALGTYGWVISIGLYSIGLVQIVLAFALVNAFGFSSGNMLLVLTGIGAMVVALCKMEHPRETFRGYVHIFGAGIQFLFFPFALLQLSGYFLGSTLYTLTLMICSLNFLSVGFILFFFLTNTTHESRYFGLIQKTNIVSMNLWVVLVSFLYM